MVNSKAKNQRHLIIHRLDVVKREELDKEDSTELSRRRNKRYSQAAKARMLIKREEIEEAETIKLTGSLVPTVVGSRIRAAKIKPLIGPSKKSPLDSPAGKRRSRATKTKEQDLERIREERVAREAENEFWNNF